MKKIIGWIVFVFGVIGISRMVGVSFADGTFGVKDVVEMIPWILLITLGCVLANIVQYYKSNKILFLSIAFIIMVPGWILGYATFAASRDAYIRPTAVNTIVVDVPTLSAQEVISIAKEHSVRYPSNAREKYLGTYVDRTGGTQGWHTDYMGNGKWIVEFWWGGSTADMTVYRWTVVETNLNALFLGTYNESLILFKQQYGYYPK